MRCFFQLLIRHTADSIHAGAFDERPVFLCEQLNALRRAVCALVVLSVQIGDRKDLVILSDGEFLAVDVVYGRFGKDVDDGAFQLFLADPLHVVTQDLAQVLHADPELRFQIFADLLRLQVLFFLNKNSVNHPSYSSALYLIPMSVRYCIPSKEIFFTLAYALARASFTVFPFAHTPSTLPPFVFNTPLSRTVPA